MICSVVSCFCSGRCVIVSSQHYHTLLSSVGVLVLYSLEPISLKTVDMWFIHVFVIIVLCARVVTSKPPQAKTLQVITACRIKPITQIGWVIWTESDHDPIALQLTNQMCMLWLTATQGDWHCFLIHFIFGTQLEHGSRRLSALSGSRQSFGGKQKDNCKQSVVACSTMSLCLKISQPTKNKNYADNAQLISSICLLNWTNWTTYHLEMMPWAKQAILESKQSS